MADITIVGNLTDAPELRYTNAGKPMAKFSVAENRRFQKDGEWQEETSFYNCTAWDDLAENAAESLGKGDRVVLSGRIEQRSWETDEGEKRSTYQVTAFDLGASVRWATVAVTRTERRGGNGNGGEKKSTPARNTPPDQFDEEPF